MSLRSANEINQANSGKAFRQAPADKTFVQNMVREAHARRKDSQNKSVSTGLRIDACHDAALMLSLAVLNAGGLRGTAAPGHHANALEAACQAVGAPLTVFDELDAVLRLRNTKYDGSFLSEQDLKTADAAYVRFEPLVMDWFEKKHSALFKP
ncbi:MAG: hypothetical protein JF626_05560 [Polaromonas sp.]|nr:hypothetical protein [Polaromonas sp.]